MVQVTMLSDSEVQMIQTKLEEYRTVSDSDLTQYLTEEQICEGDVNLRFFPMPESGDAESIYFEVYINEEADWKESDFASYSDQNMMNGSRFYVALSNELNEIIDDVCNTTVDFIQLKGGRAFTAEAEV